MLSPWIEQLKVTRHGRFAPFVILGRLDLSDRWRQRDAGISMAPLLYGKAFENIIVDGGPAGTITSTGGTVLLDDGHVQLAWEQTRELRWKGRVVRCRVVIVSVAR
jgi:hypothetical protein